MALYEVTRTDMADVGPGEFINGLVVAGGVAQARRAVQHLDGVTKSNIRAERFQPSVDAPIISAYFDEREPDYSALFGDAVE